MNNNPVFVAGPRTWQAQVSVANTARDGSGTLVNLLTGGTNGTRIDRIVVKATATNLAGTIRFFMYDGTNTWLWLEIAVPAVTASASVPAQSVELVRTDNFPLTDLPANWILKVSTEKAETWNAQAYGGDL